MLFVQEILTDEDLKTHYASIVPDPAYADPDNEENLAFYYRLLKREIERRAPKGRILDIGCAKGQFLDVMQGWETFGTEIGPDLAVAREKYGRRISELPIDRCGWEADFFDVIVMQDCFDHMLRPLEVLRACRRLLKPGGLLVVKVHDISSLFARISGSKYYALSPPSHLSYFSPRSLRLSLTKSGFDCQAIRYFPHLLFLRTVFQRLSRGSDGSIFYPIYRALRRSRLGSLRIRKNVFDIMTVFAAKAG